MKKNRSRLVVGLVCFTHGCNWVFLLVLCLTQHVRAQPSQSSSDGYEYGPSVKVSPSMAVVLVSLVSAFFLMGCISVYVRRCAERRMANGLGVYGTNRSILSRRAAARGLDSSIVDTFPMFQYSEVKGLKIGKESLECAVCLNEFEDEETLRLLPKCSHAFHPDCIDAWLVAHVTCPVCRANLVPKPGELGKSNSPSHNLDAESQTDDSVLPQVHDSVLVHNDVRSPDINITSPLGTPNHNRTRKSTPRRPPRIMKFPRSHSTGHSLIQPGENCERFTLRLPEDVRNRLVNTGLNRTKSCVAFPRAMSSKKGYRSSSCGTGQGRAGVMSYERLDQEERWGFGSKKAGEGDDGAAASKNLLKSVKLPFERLFSLKEKDNVGERSFDRLRPDDQV